MKSPFYCPFCGEENLFPHGEKHGEWECRACRRVFAVKFIGLLSRSEETLGRGTNDQAAE